VRQGAAGCGVIRQCAARCNKVRQDAARCGNSYDYIFKFFHYIFHLELFIFGGQRFIFSIIFSCQSIRNTINSIEDPRCFASPATVPVAKNCFNSVVGVWRHCFDSAGDWLLTQ
jgi:hypothetical protein